eukprot:TRINITY_DN5927_c0_g1_i1.p1 TRINITY_DN5927_c0_g1~~TRINITY_DN5927_c0_g1_i1.p1  ORF type:complete len:366 (+),score=56.57 TRINITY_DN5927_c0_g1_i1:339-1436(+)
MNGRMNGGMNGWMGLKMLRNHLFIHEMAQRISEIPHVDTNAQILYLWKNRPLRRTLLQIIATQQLRECPESLTLFTNAIDDLVERKANDSSIYEQLRDLFHKEITQSDEYIKVTNYRSRNQSNARAESRSQQITTLIPRRGQIRSLLDIGCSEGSITESLGSDLGLCKDNIFGCDVRNIGGKGFHFVPMAKEDELPFEDNSQSIVTALMTLHHMKYPDRILREAYRVLDDGGYLIIREHDHSFPELSVLLDIIHGLYSIVWPKEKEMEDFCQHHATYREKRDWDQMIRKVGFQHISTDYTRSISKKNGYVTNPQQTYYSVYRKVENHKRKRGSPETKRERIDSISLHSSEDEIKKKLRAERFGST